MTDNGQTLPVFHSSPATEIVGINVADVRATNTIPNVHALGDKIVLSQARPQT
jgi:hypothetical protein